MTYKTRLEKVAVSLSPTQAVVAWMAAAHAYPTFTAYATSLIGQPDAAFPLVRLPEQVEQATRRALKGEAHERVEWAVRQAVRDVHFLYAIHQHINIRLLDANELLHVRLQALVEGYQQLLVEELLASELAHLQSRSRRRPSDNLALPSWAQPAGRLGRVRLWCGHALELLGQLYTHRALVEQLAQRYFAGQALLYPAAASYLAELIDRTERVVTLFNEGLAEGDDRTAAGG